MLFWIELFIYRGLSGAVGIAGMALSLAGKLFSVRWANWVLARTMPKPLAFQPNIWFHSVSLGECQLLLAFLAEIPAMRKWPVLLTTTTQSGFNILNKRWNPEQVRFLPWETGFALKRFFRGRHVPDLILVETEIWPLLYHFVHGKGSRIAIINGRLSEKTLRWRRFAILKRSVSLISHVSARSQTDKLHFETLGLAPDRIRVTGNMKYDLKSIELDPGALTQWLEMPGDLVVFASISTEEAPLLAPQAEKLLAEHPNLRMVWAPRQTEDTPRHRAWLTRLNPVLRSQLDERTSRLMILDTRGELAGCYRFARLSLVGGSFNKRGGQNFLESLQVGTPAIIGPFNRNFRDAVADALRAQAIIQLGHPEAVAPTISSLLSDPNTLADMAARSAGFITSHSGAVVATLKALVELGILEPRGDDI